jgi:hypothetical protein
MPANQREFFGLEYPVWEAGSGEVTKPMVDCICSLATCSLAYPDRDRPTTHFYPSYLSACLQACRIELRSTLALDELLRLRYLVRPETYFVGAAVLREAENGLVKSGLIKRALPEESWKFCKDAPESRRAVEGQPGDGSHRISNHDV